MKKIIVVYHGGCADGFSGAWVARKKFGNKADYIGVRHVEFENRTDFQFRARGNKFYFIDIVFPENTMKQLMQTNDLTVIDHHISSRKRALAVPDHLFDLKHSGAVLAWKYFFPKKKIPQLLRYIEDRDLWSWKLSKSREIGSYLDLHEFSWKNWDQLARELESPISRKKAVEKGGLVRRIEKRLVGAMVHDAGLVKFVGRTVYAVNAPVLHSEVGNELVSRRPPFSITWREQQDTIRVSLRSNGKYDVVKLAEKFGGGGHKAAAAFNVPIGKTFPWKRIKK